MSHRATDVTSGPCAEVDLVALGGRTGMLWRSPRLTLAGIGPATRILIARPDGGSTAQLALNRMGAGDDERPGAGPVAFAAMPFDPAADAELFVPRAVICDDGERRWVSSSMSMTEIDAVVAALLEPSVVSWPTRFTVAPNLPADTWRDEVVSAGRDRVASGGLQKVVLARRLAVEADAPIDPAVVAARLAMTFPTANLFLVDGFVGASPELLVSRDGRTVRAHPLAGTAARLADPAADAAQVDDLLASTKDRVEHRITIDWLLTELLPFCSYVDAEPDPTVVSMANVHHLATLVEGVLSEPVPSILDLVAAVHPTPAVGGDPQGEAIELISDLERFDRGRYAGPAGWVDGAGNGEFAVSVRSAQLDGASATVCAGVGVVRASEPEAELIETQSKFGAALGALLH